jgi:hypothetical protein
MNGEGKEEGGDWQGGLLRRRATLFLGVSHTFINYSIARLYARDKFLLLIQKNCGKSIRLLCFRAHQ